MGFSAFASIFTADFAAGDHRLFLRTESGFAMSFGNQTIAVADGAAKTAHINAHKKAMMLQRTRPDLFAGLPPSAANPQQGTAQPGQQIGQPTITPGAGKGTPSQNGLQ